MTTTMRAVRIHSYGSADVLLLDEVPRPEIAADEVLVRVEAAAVNPVDWMIRAGYMAEYFGHRLPLTLGWDVSGVVDAAGAEVSTCSVGDEVFARADISRDGSYAEYVAVRAAEVVRKPAGVGHVDAAAVPHAALTAYQALFDTAGLAEGQAVLIHGAAGGVGTFAVQLAKRRGAQVIGTCSANNLAFLQKLGVDEAIDYNATPFEEAVRDVDVVLDTVGSDTQDRSWRVLKPGGILVSLLTPPSPEEAARHGVRHGFVAMAPDRGQLQELAHLLDAGQVTPVVSYVLPLEEARRAHQQSETRHTRGKIVLQVNA